MMHRQPNHVMTFLLAELGTSGSLDGQQSPDTMLSKKNRLLPLKCEECGSERSVAQIKAGFLARVGSRNART
ncbi:unnamed protein product [Prunus armeniaca]|uniref:Translation initiation factor IF2/IF5 domain-containing protein n=1 Tax=Prunus armeniaca TaxID=36596 RepID=A0A6J5TQE3_PRUAR|nr:unnamed protein product [Prunus armeniaca]CAB4295299.1 unnamed protein product [Prunus armeniaca]